MLSTIFDLVRRTLNHGHWNSDSNNMCRSLPRPVSSCIIDGTLTKSKETATKAKNPIQFEYRVSQKERAPTSRIFFGNKNYLIWHSWYYFSKRISSALTEFLQFWYPSLNSKVTIILVARSLFDAVHGLQITFVVLHASWCAHAVHVTIHNCKLRILPWLNKNI